MKRRLHRALTKAHLYLAALNWANEVRIEKGLRPLLRLPRAAHPGSGSLGESCPLGQAIQGWVGTHDFHKDGFYGEPGGHRELPPEARRFVTMFDSGLFPRLEHRPVRGWLEAR